VFVFVNIFPLCSIGFHLFLEIQLEFKNLNLLFFNISFHGASGDN